MEERLETPSTGLSYTKVNIKNTDLRQTHYNHKRTLALSLPKKANDNFRKRLFWSVENLITNSNLHTIRNGPAMAVQYKQDTKTVGQ